MRRRRCLLLLLLLDNRRCPRSFEVDRCLLNRRRLLVDPTVLYTLWAPQSWLALHNLILFQLLPLQEISKLPIHLGTLLRLLLTEYFAFCPRSRCRRLLHVRVNRLRSRCMRLVNVRILRSRSSNLLYEGIDLSRTRSWWLGSVRILLRMLQSSGRIYDLWAWSCSCRSELWSRSSWGLYIGI